jgi:hypothetical protein
MGKWEKAAEMSVRLRDYLHRIRQTLHPGIADHQGLPRRIQQPLHQLLELHTFLTTHTHPPRASHTRQPAPVPPDDRVLASAAAHAGVEEKRAFVPTPHSRQQQQQ